MISGKWIYTISCNIFGGIEMKAVIIVLIIVVLFLGWVHMRKLKNDRIRRESGCDGGCAGCIARNSCDDNKKK